MRLCFDPTLCPKARISDVIQTAKSSGFDAMILHCIKTASSPFHPKASVRVIRDHFDEAGITLAGLNIRNLTGLNDKSVFNLEASLRLVEWDIHLARALRAQSANIKCGPKTKEARDALITGVNTLLENISDITLNIGNSTDTCLENINDFKSVMSQLPDGAKIWLDSTQIKNSDTCIETFADRIGHVTASPDDAKTFQALTTSKYTSTVALDLENVSGDPVEIAQKARQGIEEMIHVNR